MKTILISLAKNWIRLLVSVAIVLTVTLIYLTFQNGWHFYIVYIDGMCLGGFTTFLIGMLVLLGDFGTFNIFSYYAGRKKLPNGKKEDFYNYSERVKEQRKNKKLDFLPYTIVGILFTIINGVLILAL